MVLVVGWKMGHLGEIAYLDKFIKVSIIEAKRIYFLRGLTPNSLIHLKK